MTQAMGASSAPSQEPSEAQLCVAVCQMISGPSIGQNLHQAALLIEQAIQRGAQLILLPEYFAALGEAIRFDAVEVKTDQPSPAEHPIQFFLAEQARRHQIVLVAGSVGLVSHAEAKRQGTFQFKNTCLVYDSNGACMARYEKMHLFCFEQGKEAYDERKYLLPGTEIQTFEYCGFQIGLSICYDLRFPELYRARQMDVWLVPAAFTETTGRAHWQVLLQARAIENLAYVMAANQGGIHPDGRKTFGHSMLIDPWGSVMQRAEYGEQVLLAILRRDRIEQVRSALPALQHRIPFIPDA